LTEADIEEWIIETPSILGEDLLVVASQYAKFDRTAERPDVLALDPDGKLVVIELKRDSADKTTDLQAIKYASYCSTISAEELQQDFRAFWNKRRDEDDQLTPEEVGDRFTEFLGEDVATTEDGYADFVLDDRPRILLAAGSFGPEITTPVVWLEREYGMDITCIELDVHQRDEEVFVSARQVLPIPEAEEYMAKRRQKERQQNRSSSRAERAITVLLEAALVKEGTSSCSTRKAYQMMLSASTIQKTTSGEAGLRGRRDGVTTWSGWKTVQSTRSLLWLKRYSNKRPVVNSTSMDTRTGCTQSMK